MSDTKSGSKSGSQKNLNESTLPLLEEQGQKEEKIEMENKGEKNDAESGDKNDKKKKKEKKIKEKKPGPTRTPLTYAQNFTVGLNVLDRDEKHINDHVNLAFEDVIGEPDPTHGFEFIWRLTYLFFNATRFWIYRFIAAIIAIPLALFWAVFFAFLNVGTIWCFTPSFRVFDIIIHHLHRLWSGLVRTFLDPFFASGALLFSNIRNRVSTDKEFVVSP